MQALDGGGDKRERAGCKYAHTRTGADWYPVRCSQPVGRDILIQSDSPAQSAGSLNQTAKPVRLGKGSDATGMAVWKTRLLISPGTMY